MIKFTKPNKKYLIMKEDNNMLTVSQIINILNERGVENELRMNSENFFYIENTNVVYQHPKDLEIVKIYRFEGNSNPDDSAVIYVMRDIENRKSFLLDAYGAQSNYGEEFARFLQRIPVNESEHY